MEQNPVLRTESTPSTLSGTSNFFLGIPDNTEDKALQAPAPVQFQDLRECKWCRAKSNKYRTSSQKHCDSCAKYASLFYKDVWCSDPMRIYRRKFLESCLERKESFKMPQYQQYICDGINTDTVLTDTQTAFKITKKQRLIMKHLVAESIRRDRAGGSTGATSQHTNTGNSDNEANGGVSANLKAMSGKRKKTTRSPPYGRKEKASATPQPRTTTAQHIPILSQVVEQQQQKQQQKQQQLQAMKINSEETQALLNSRQPILEARSQMNEMIAQLKERQKQIDLEYAVQKAKIKSLVDTNQQKLAEIDQILDADAERITNALTQGRCPT